MENEKKALKKVKIYHEKLTEFGDLLSELNIFDFNCPICHDVMDTNCITLSSGKNYHETCISLSIKELSKKGSPVICPLTRQPLNHKEKKFEFEPNFALMASIDSLFSLFIQGVFGKSDIASKPSSMEPWIEFKKKLVQPFPEKALEELEKYFKNGRLVVTLVNPQSLFEANELVYIKIIGTHEKSRELLDAKMEGLIKEMKEAKLEANFFNIRLQSEIKELRGQLEFSETDAECKEVQLNQKELKIKQQSKDLEGVKAQLEQKNLELKQFKDITDDLRKATQTVETEHQHTQQKLNEEKQKVTQLDSINKRLLLKVRLKDLGLEKISLNLLQLPEKTFFQIYLHFNSSEDENLFCELFSLPRCIDITGEEKLQSTLKLLRNFEDIPVELSHEKKPAQWNKTLCGLIEILHDTCSRTKELITIPPLKDHVTTFFSSLSALPSAPKFHFYLNFDSIFCAYIENLPPLHVQTLNQLNSKNLTISSCKNEIKIEFNWSTYEKSLEELGIILEQFDDLKNSTVEIKKNSPFVVKTKLCSAIDKISPIIPQAQKAFDDFFANQNIIKTIIFTLEDENITSVVIHFKEKYSELKKLILTELNLGENTGGYWKFFNEDEKLSFIAPCSLDANDEGLKLLAYLSLNHNLEKIDIEFIKNKAYEEVPAIITFINNLIPNAAEVFKAASVKPFWL